MERPKHGGHLVAQVLKNEGVANLFTLSGGHIAPIYDGCVAEGIRIVDFRHEQSAALIRRLTLPRPAMLSCVERRGCRKA